MGQILYSGEVANTAALSLQTAYTTTDITAPLLSGIGVVVNPQNGTTLYVNGSATLSNATLGDGAIAGIYYAAASSVPAAGTAIAGYTAYGNLSVVSTAAAQENVVPLDAVITGLTPNTDYVITVGVEAVTGGTASMTLNSLTVKDTI